MLEKLKAATGARHLCTSFFLFCSFLPLNGTRLVFIQTLSHSGALSTVAVCSIRLTWRIIFLRTGSSRFHREVLRGLKNRKKCKKKTIILIQSREERKHFVLEKQNAPVTCMKRSSSKSQLPAQTTFTVKPPTGKQQCGATIYHRRTFKVTASESKGLVHP